jgi:hypothetical protein
MSNTINLPVCETTFHSTSWCSGSWRVDLYVNLRFPRYCAPCLAARDVARGSPTRIVCQSHRMCARDHHVAIASCAENESTGNARYVQNLSLSHVLRDDNDFLPEQIISSPSKPFPSRAIRASDGRVPPTRACAATAGRSPHVRRLGAAPDRARCQVSCCSGSSSRPGGADRWRIPAAVWRVDHAARTVSSHTPGNMRSRSRDGFSVLPRECSQVHPIFISGNVANSLIYDCHTGGSSLCYLSPGICPP